MRLSVDGYILPAQRARVGEQKPRSDRINNKRYTTPISTAAPKRNTALFMAVFLVLVVAAEGAFAFLRLDDLLTVLAAMQQILMQAASVHVVSPY